MKGIDPFFVLAVANARVTSWYAQRKLSNFGKDVFPKLNPEDIKNLPIVIAEDNSSVADSLATLAKQFTETKARMIAATRQSDRERLQQKCDYFDGQIDRLVYQLYGLTEEEIRIVEG